MSRSHARNRPLAVATALLLTVVLMLRGAMAWAGTGPIAGAPGASPGSPLAKGNAALLAPLRPALARCEAANDDPPPIRKGRSALVRWSAPALAHHLPTVVTGTRSPATPPPARAPPLLML